MSNNFTGILFAIGFGGWVYVQMNRRSANRKAVWIVTFAAGAIGFFVVSTALGFIS
jgi:hypothetical protein